MSRKVEVLPVGKLPADILKRLLGLYTSTNHGVVVGPSIGEDAAAIDFGESYLLITTDPKKCLSQFPNRHYIKRLFPVRHI